MFLELQRKKEPWKRSSRSFQANTYHGKEVGGPYNPKPDFHMHNKRARVYLYKFGKMQKFKKFKIDV